MKIDNGKHKFEKRRKRFFTPIIYMFAEISLAWVVLSVINVSFQVQTWNTWSYVALSGAFMYSAFKTYHVFDRQKNYERA